MCFYLIYLEDIFDTHKTLIWGSLLRALPTQDFNERIVYMFTCISARLSPYLSSLLPFKKDDETW